MLPFGAHVDPWIHFEQLRSQRAGGMSMLSCQKTSQDGWSFSFGYQIIALNHGAESPCESLQEIQYLFPGGVLELCTNLSSSCSSDFSPSHCLRFLSLLPQISQSCFSVLPQPSTRSIPPKCRPKFPPL